MNFSSLIDMPSYSKEFLVRKDAKMLKTLYLDISDEFGAILLTYY